jgi:hypothetical protein
MKDFKFKESDSGSRDAISRNEEIKNFKRNIRLFTLKIIIRIIAIPFSPIPERFSYRHFCHNAAQAPNILCKFIGIFIICF